MGLLDSLLGRNKKVAPNLDALFGVPSAAISLEAALGLRPTGVGALSVKLTEGAAYSAAHDEAESLLRFDPTAKIDDSVDDFGFRWTTVRTSPDALGDLVTALHGANTTYAGAGFGTFTGPYMFARGGGLVTSSSNDVAPRSLFTPGSAASWPLR